MNVRQTPKFSSLPSLVIFAILFSVLLVTPVIAAPATKTQFTATSYVPSFGNLNPGTELTTQGNIYHITGAVSSGTVSGGLSGTIRSETTLTYNMKTGWGNCHNKIVVTVNGGTFEGSQRGKHVIDFNTMIDYHSGSFMLHGTGDFEGQKILASYEGTANLVLNDVSMTITGIILAP